MFKLETAEIWNSFVSFTYTRESPHGETFPDRMYLTIDHSEISDENMIEGQIVFHVKGETFVVNHTFPRRIISDDPEVLLGVWKEIYLNGSFE